MNLKKLEKIIRTLMRKRHTPGMAIGIIKDGETIYANGFGARDLKNNLPMNADTLIGIGSITKSFTAFAIMKLQEMGKLSLDDSGSNFLDAEPFKSRPQIKIRHMLSHSSGVPSLDAGMLSFACAFDDYSCLYPATSREDFLAHMADAEEFIIFEPGEKFFYNNDMYTCLGFIIEQLSGVSFEEFIQREILHPLEMTRGVMTQEGLDKDPDNNSMTGYLIETKVGKAAAKASAVPIGGHFQAPGGLYVSMTEMLNYAQYMINEGEFNGHRLLSGESVAAIFSGEIVTPYGAGDAPEYGLGWSIEAKSEEMPYTVIQHGGGMGTSNSFLILVPELNLGIVAAENAGTGITPVVCRAAISLALGQDPETEVEDLRLGRALDEVEGCYKSQYNMYELKVSRANNVLQAELQTDDGYFSFPLLVKDLDNLDFSTYSLKAGNKAAVVFYRNKTSGAVEFSAYDRFLYRRV